MEVSYSLIKNLVEFSPVEPDSAAFRAVIDFDALAFGHDKVGFVANRAFHVFFSFGSIVGFAKQAFGGRSIMLLCEFRVRDSIGHF